MKRRGVSTIIIQMIAIKENYSNHFNPKHFKLNTNILENVGYHHTSFILMAAIRTLMSATHIWCGSLRFFPSATNHSIQQEITLSKHFNSLILYLKTLNGWFPLTTNAIHHKRLSDYKFSAARFALSIISTIDAIIETISFILFSILMESCSF